MELENATIIDFGDVELLATKEDLYMGYDNEAKFKINWCRLKDKPDELIRLNVEYDKLSKEIQEMADEKAKIPMLGKTESLNASVAAGVVMYEYVRQKLSK